MYLVDRAGRSYMRHVNLLCNTVGGMLVPETWFPLSPKCRSLAEFRGLTRIRDRLCTTSSVLLLRICPAEIAARPSTPRGKSQVYRVDISNCGPIHVLSGIARVEVASD